MWAQTEMHEYGLPSLVHYWRKKERDAIRAATFQIISPIGIPSEEAFGKPDVQKSPQLLVQAAIVVLGDKTNEGSLVEAVSLPWFEIIKEIERDPRFLFEIPWRKLEELIAAAYKRAGFPEVVLTPPSRDRGGDIIATRPGIGSIRLIDQVKAYAPNHRVSANDVRALLGVLERDKNVSKGIVTTTSSFAPGIFKELEAFIPFRLELKDGKQLQEWLFSLKGP